MAFDPIKHILVMQLWVGSCRVEPELIRLNGSDVRSDIVEITVR